METAIQNGAMAAGYAVLFLLLLRHPLRQSLWGFIFACGFATAYNIAYDTAIHFRVIVSLALFVRLLPPVEACWNVVVSRKDVRGALAFLLASVGLGTFSPTNLAFGYLTVRGIATTAVTLVCGLVLASNYFSPFGASIFALKHLKLQTAWMVFHSIFSLSSQWYNSTWSRRAIARWAYVLLALALVVAYRRILTSPLARREAEPADRPS